MSPTSVSATLTRGGGRPTSGPPTVSRRRSISGSAKRFGWFLFTPSLLLVLLVTIVPIGQAVQLSLSDTDGFNPGAFVGFDNYRRFFADPLSTTNLVRTLIFTAASLLLTVPLSVGLALLLNQRFPGRTVVRAVLITPWVVSQLLAALMWRWVVSPDIGPLGYLLSSMAGVRTDLFGGEIGAMVGIVLANVWRTFPYGMIIVLAALQTVPAEVHEAGKIDGASALQRLLHLTLPLIRGPLLISVIILSINAVNMVELPLLLTGGGPLNATDLIGLRVFREAFQFQDFGIASAAAMVMFAMNVVLSLAYIKVLRSERD